MRRGLKVALIAANVPGIILARRLYRYLWLPPEVRTPRLQRRTSR